MICGTTPIEQLPDELYNQVESVGYYAASLDGKPEQARAREEVYNSLNAGPVEALPEALRALGRTHVKDIQGNKIPLARNWTTRSAYRVAEDIETWLEEEKQVKAA